MNKSLMIAGGTIAIVSSLLATPAQAQIKIGTLDVQKVLAGYYKTQEAEAKIQEAQKSANEELNQRMDTYKKDLDSINKLNEEMNKPDVSAAGKDQKSQERDSKIAEVKGLEKEMSEFKSTREKQLREQYTLMLRGLVEEIMRVVTDQVKAQSYDLVFDKSGQGANSPVPILVFANNNYDFSESVISKLNANRPPTAATPQKSAATATGSIPPTVSKPGGFPTPRKQK